MGRYTLKQCVWVNVIVEDRRPEAEDTSYSLSYRASGFHTTDVGHFDDSNHYCFLLGRGSMHDVSTTL
jgi:hypothetical protein